MFCFYFRLINKVLIREPEKRITLDDLSKTTWMQVEKPNEEDLIPLVWRKTVQPEDQNEIIHQMVLGKIGTKESILRYKLKIIAVFLFVLNKIKTYILYFFIFKRRLK